MEQILKLSSKFVELPQAIHHTRVKFKTANGDVSAYGLTCGHVQSKHLDASNYIELYQEAACRVFQVRGRCRAFAFWESFSSVTAARNYYRHKLATLKVEAHI